METNERLYTLINRYGRRLGIVLYMIDKRLTPYWIYYIAINIVWMPISYYLKWLGISSDNRAGIQIAYLIFGVVGYFAVKATYKFILYPIVKAIVQDYQNTLAQTERKAKD